MLFWIPDKWNSFSSWLDSELTGIWNKCDSQIGLKRNSQSMWTIGWKWYLMIKQESALVEEFKKINIQNYDLMSPFSCP